jgi:hypothetical protein
MSLSWSLANGWTVKQPEINQVLNPGEKIILPIQLTGPNTIGTIPPKGKIAFSGTDGEKAFRNDELLFFPVKLWSDALYSQMMTSQHPVANKAALTRSITLIPLPIRKMDGTIVDYRPITNDYPANGLEVEKALLNGKIWETEFDDELSENGEAELRGEDRMTISFETDTPLGQIELDLRAKGVNTMLCIGQFKLVPRARTPMANLGKNELSARIENDLDQEFDPAGWLKITAYAKNGIAGEFELKGKTEEGEDSILRGKFKLPLALN